jgi:hypothetical protein
MKGLLLLIGLALVLSGCGGRTAQSIATPARFAGTYAGPWVNVDDPEDEGTAEWTFNENGVVTGQEFGPNGGASGTVRGTIDAMGNLTSVLTEETEASAFNGTLTPDGSGNLTGTIVWQGPPAISYRYSLSRIR